MVVSLAALLPATALAGDWIYLYNEKGVRTFTDQRPSKVAYTQVPMMGRETARASCLGLTERSMQARAKRYATLIDRHAKQVDLSPKLVSAVMRVESCYDHRAVSRSGAQGLMQLMPATALELGVSNSFNAEQNIRGGVTYLSRMMKRFKDDLRLALAAYNAGPGAVENHGNTIPPYPATQSYVKRILKLYERGA